MSEGPRILTFAHSFAPGGVERVALRLCEAWQAAGASLTVLLGRREGAAAAQAPRLDYRCHASGIVPTRRFETLWMILCAWRWLRAERADVIFCPGNSYTVVAVALRLLFPRSCPPIVAKVSNLLDRRDMPLAWRAGYRLWLWLQGRCIDHWVAIAGPLRGEIERFMAVPAARVAAIDDPAIDARAAGELRARREVSGRAGRAGRILLTVGRLAPQKRLDLLIRAFHRGARQDDRLVILGDGPCRRRLIRLVADLGLAGRVALIGHCDDVGEWLARADLFVLASDYEGLSAVLVEAMAAEIPIVSTISSPGVADLLGEGRLGRLVPPGDLVALAAAIGAEPPPLDRDGMRRQVARFLLDRAAPAYLRLLREIARAGADIAGGERLPHVDNQRRSHRVSH